jgi:DNA-binding FadR family transcriptional regulator
VQTLFAADCRFHVTILEGTHNQVMQQMRQVILTMLRVSYEFGVRPQNAPVTREGHVAVAEAIARHDAEAARTAMVEMLHKNESIAEEHWLQLPSVPLAGAR